MTTPFRTRPDEGPQLTTSEAVHDAIHQMVRQFADPMAWLRELVQNALDAGATGITVHLDYQPDRASDRGTLRASVTDDGHGMDQDTVERSLVVLFRSTKDRDPSKIGKFGVGFFSVFGAGPSVVLVDTGRADAPESLRLTFRPDFTYELEALPPRRGTTVTLTLTRSAAEASEFAERAHAALSRWCPHVAAPLHLRTEGIPAGDRDVRIDRPFDIDGPITITHRADARTLLALAVDPHASVAFYNRGILLHETESPIPGVRWKVDAHDLHHTVSRDNVRRDAAFERVQQLAATLARSALRERFVASVALVAGRCAAARHAKQPCSEAALLGTLARLALDLPYKLKPAEFVWPLAHPIASEPDRLTASFAPGILQRPERRYATAPSPLTAALARRDIPVVDLGAAGPTADAMLTLLRAHHHEDRVAPADERYLLARPLPESALAPDAKKLLAALRPLLPALGLRDACLGALDGCGSDRAFALFAHDPRSTEFVLDATKDHPAALDDGRTLLLHAPHPRVAAAVAAARSDAALAALALLRSVALDAGALDARRDLALFTLATPS